MNIFQHKNSFFGCLDSTVSEDSLLSIFKLAKQIRLRLGKQGYLLGNYLSMIFEKMCSKLAYEAADEGFQMCGELQGLLFHVLDGTEPKKPHPLYHRVQEFYEQYSDRLIFQERHTNLSLLLFPLADEIMKYFTEEFIREQVRSLGGEVDEVRLYELYDQISHLAGEAMMVELNQRIKQRFIITPLATLFAQGFTDDLLYKLTSRDHETSKQMFQLLLNTIPANTERV